MSLTADNKSNYELPPAGTTHGVCYAIYDLGTQYNPRFEVSQRKGLFCWELPDDRMADGRPFAVSKIYTISLNDKATLRKDLEAWRGKPFTKEEVQGFDLKKLIGANCQLGIVHNDSGEKTYANVNSIMPLHKTMEKREPVNKVVTYEIGNEIPEDTPEWIQNLIKKSEEWHVKEEWEGDPPEEVTDLEPF